MTMEGFNRLKSIANGSWCLGSPAHSEVAFVVTSVGCLDPRRDLFMGFLERYGSFTNERCGP
jgi:hypothetical protein